MNSATDHTTAISATRKRIILASAYRHEQHATGRQERAVKSLRKMSRLDDNELPKQRRLRSISSTDETLDD
jgi:hypothetical protein